jgi:hypothetical protein
MMASDHGGQIADPVERLVGHDGVEDLGDGPADGPFEVADRPGGELAVHHLAVEGVDRRVEMEDREGVESPRPIRAHGVVDQDPPSRHEAVGVPADRADVVVAGHRPAAFGCPVDGRLHPEIGQDVEVVGPEEEAGPGQVEMKVGHIGHGTSWGRGMSAGGGALPLGGEFRTVFNFPSSRCRNGERAPEEW